jgi:hypothetical protein
VFGEHLRVVIWRAGLAHPQFPASTPHSMACLGAPSLVRAVMPASARAVVQCGAQPAAATPRSCSIPHARSRSARGSAHSSARCAAWQPVPGLLARPQHNQGLQLQHSRGPPAGDAPGAPAQCARHAPTTPHSAGRVATALTTHTHYHTHYHTHTHTERLHQLYSRAMQLEVDFFSAQPGAPPPRACAALGWCEV